MKKDQSTRVKDTKNKAFHKTLSFTCLPHFCSLKEAKQFIQILLTTSTALEKKVVELKDNLAESADVLCRMQDLIESKRDLIKKQQECIETLMVDKGDRTTFEALQNSLSEKDSLVKAQSNEIKGLRQELKKAKNFHYRDFIFN
jgi:hypothetical protein